MKIIISLFFAVLIAGCNTYSEEELSEFDQEIQTYIAQNNLKCTKSNSGLYYQIKKEGVGSNIKYQDSIQFTYTSYLLDGTLVEDQKKPVQFAVKDLIAAWKEIALLVNSGSEVLLITPPQLAYGEHELDDIPQNSILIFDMKIIGRK
jgi:FKBP-type peptidyl-prolyl cis-trans isomerase FkpA